MDSTLFCFVFFYFDRHIGIVFYESNIFNKAPKTFINIKNKKAKTQWCIIALSRIDAKDLNLISEKFKQNPSKKPLNFVNDRRMLIIGVFNDGNCFFVLFQFGF